MQFVRGWLHWFDFVCACLHVRPPTQCTLAEKGFQRDRTRVRLHRHAETWSRVNQQPKIKLELAQIGRVAIVIHIMS